MKADCQTQDSTARNGPDWGRFKEIVGGAERFLITSHIRPDCDALGSELAMAGILESLGKEAVIVNAQPTPPNYAFLDAENRFQTLGTDISIEECCRRDVMIVLDTTAWAQLGAMGDVVRAFAGVKAVIDHHVSGDELGAELFKNTTADSTGRLVVEAAEQLGVKLTPDIARAAFVAVATDTGWFRFSSTQSSTLRIAADLMDAGAKPAELYQELYERESLARLNLVGRTLGRTVTELDGRLIYTHIAHEDFEATGAVPSDSEDMINMTLAVAGTEVAVIFVEQKTGGFKISFRSRCDVDCSQLAKQFNGGGHKKAAGAFIEGELEDARAKVLDAVRAAMR